MHSNIYDTIIAQNGKYVYTMPILTDP